MIKEKNRIVLSGNYNIHDHRHLNTKQVKKEKCPQCGKIHENIESKTKIKLSPFLFLYEFKDREFVCLYNALNIKKIYGDRRLKKIYEYGKENSVFNIDEIKKILGKSKETDEVIDLLFKNEMLVNEKYTSTSAIKRIQDSCHGTLKPRISIFYFMLSNACNFQCKYCTIESDLKKPRKHFKFKHMPLETAKKGVDLYAKIMDDNAAEYTFIFYGGEPLLNKDVFMETVRYIREVEENGGFKGKTVSITINTNATEIDKEMADFFKKYNIGAGISIDGMEKHHDNMRIYKESRKGTFADVIRGYKLLQEATGYTPGISCTMGLHNYKDLEEIAEFFATELETRGMGINLYKGLPPDTDLEIDQDVATYWLIKVYEIFRKYGIYEDRIMRKVKLFINEQPWYADCGAYGGQVALNVDGYLGPCHIMCDDNRELLGHIDDKDIIDKIFNGELMLKWARHNVIHMPQCYECEALSACGGGCVDECIAKGRDFWDLDIQFCKHSKTALKWLIKDLGDKIYNVKN